MSLAGNPTTVGPTTYRYDIRGRVVTESFQGLDTRYAFDFANVGSNPGSRIIKAPVRYGQSPCVSGNSLRPSGYRIQKGMGHGAIDGPEIGRTVMAAGCRSRAIPTAAAWRGGSNR